MIRVTVEMVPFGDERRKRRIGVAEIANVGGDRARGSYSVRISEEGKPPETGSIEGFRRDRGAWKLVAEALAKAGPPGKDPMSRTIKEMLADLEAASEKYREAGGEIAEAEHALSSALAAEHGIRTVSLGGWECQDSPTGMCYYNPDDDPCHDECLVCGHPEERK